MYYEDIKIASGDTVSVLVRKYGHNSASWQKIWNAPKNSTLRVKRGDPKRVQPNDIFFVPIPWRMTSKTLTKNGAGTRVTLKVSRDGLKGTQIRWVQTVNQSNQPIGSTAQFCVDACPPDDADPFYWTSAELAARDSLRKQFSDTPSRPAPSAAANTTTWRAILSLAVVTAKRVTVYGSVVWGFDLTSSGALTAVNPRSATAAEVRGHLNLLRKGTGSGGKFAAAGWTFRSPPVN